MLIRVIARPSHRASEFEFNFPLARVAFPTPYGRPELP